MSVKVWGPSAEDGLYLCMVEEIGELLPLSEEGTVPPQVVMLEDKPHELLQDGSVHELPLQFKLFQTAGGEKHVKDQEGTFLKLVTFLNQHTKFKVSAVVGRRHCDMEVLQFETSYLHYKVAWVDTWVKNLFKEGEFTWKKLSNLRIFWKRVLANIIPANHLRAAPSKGKGKGELARQVSSSHASTLGMLAEVWAMQQKHMEWEAHPNTFLASLLGPILDEDLELVIIYGLDELLYTPGLGHLAVADGQMLLLTIQAGGCVHLGSLLELPQAHPVRKEVGKAVGRLCQQLVKVTDLFMVLQFPSEKFLFLSLLRFFSRLLDGAILSKKYPSSSGLQRPLPIARPPLHAFLRSYLQQLKQLELGTTLSMALDSTRVAGREVMVILAVVQGMACVLPPLVHSCAKGKG